MNEEVRPARWRCEILVVPGGASCCTPRWPKHEVKRVACDLL